MKKIPTLSPSPFRPAFGSNVFTSLLFTAILGVVLATKPSARADWPQWRGPERTGAFKGPTWPADFSKLEPAWEVSLGSSYSGPIITEKLVFTTESVDKRLDVEKQLLVQTREKLCGVDPSTGKLLWSQAIKTFRGMNIQTPVIQGTRLFTSAYQGTSQAWDLSDSAGSPGVTMAWEQKSEGYMSSPVVVGGKVYMHLRNKKFTCIDLASGKQEWVTDRKFGEYWSLISQGNRLLALDENGTLYLIEANPAEFKLIAEKKLSDSETWAHLAMDDDLIVIRSLKKLQAFRWK